MSEDGRRLRVGAPCLYRPLGSSRAVLHRTILDIRVKRITPGVFGETVTRVKIGRGRGGWVNAERVSGEADV